MLNKYNHFDSPSITIYFDLSLVLVQPGCVWCSVFTVYFLYWLKRWQFEGHVSDSWMKSQPAAVRPL